MRALYLRVLSCSILVLLVQPAYGQALNVEGEYPPSQNPASKDSILRTIVAPLICYPKKAISPVVRAVVWLRVTVGEHGTAVSSEVVDCTEKGYGFEHAAQEAIESAVFLPMWKDLHAVTYSGYYPVVFSDPSSQKRVFNRKQAPAWIPQGIHFDGPRVEPLTLPTPTYPPMALDGLIEGEVILRILVNEKGTVSNAEPYYCSVSGIGFEESARSAIHHATFPIRTDVGRASKYIAFPTIRFTLTDQNIKDKGLPLPSDSIEYDRYPEILTEQPLVYPMSPFLINPKEMAWVAALVDATGRVVTARIDTTSGSELMDRVALLRTRSEQFRPAQRNGQPAAAWIRLPVKYYSTEGSPRSMSSVSPVECLPKFTHFEKAEYPEQEWQGRITGNVKVAALIDETGKLLETEIVFSSGNENLDRAALAAATKHTFTPGTTKGVPVRAKISWNVEFNPDSKTVRPPGVSSVSEVSSPRLVYEEPVQVPKEARQLGLVGKVEIGIFVGPEGTADTVKVRESSGHQSLDSAAVAAAKKYRFKPARSNGSPVGSWFVTTVNFSTK